MILLYFIKMILLSKVEMMISGMVVEVEVKVVIVAAVVFM